MQESHIGLIWPIATNAAIGRGLLASRLVHMKTKEAGTRRRNSSSPVGPSRIAASFVGDQYAYTSLTRTAKYTYRQIWSNNPTTVHWSLLCQCGLYEVKSANGTGMLRLLLPSTSSTL